jgi:hypothetical protein
MSNSPFHNPNSQPLPDANDIAREFTGERSPQPKNEQEIFIDPDIHSQLAADKRRLRNFMISLLAIGLLVGGLLAIGLVWTMSRFDLLEPQSIEQSE